MTRYLKLVLLGLLATGALIACAGNNNQQIPIAPLATCVPGQPCGNVIPQCVPGTAGCAVAATGMTTGYLHFSGQLASVNSHVAKDIIAGAYGVMSWCWGDCYNLSTIDIILTPGPNGSVGQATLNINGYPIGGQAYVFPTGNGTDVQITAFGAGRIDVITNMALDGSVSAIPAAQVQYNGQQFATASLMRAAF